MRMKRVHQTLTLDAHQTQRIDALAAELQCTRHQVMKRLLQLSLEVIAAPALPGVIRRAPSEAHTAVV
ncbi:MAG TPA: hypothetical protein VFN67_34560 [Polyangiales bacterium]|nr:hypothetical protein [Polyangiales bacterium]